MEDTTLKEDLGSLGRALRNLFVKGITLAAILGAVFGSILLIGHLLK